MFWLWLVLTAGIVITNHFSIARGDKRGAQYLYCENEPGRRSAAKQLSRDEARRIAANFAKLPGFMKAK